MYPFYFGPGSGTQSLLLQQALGVGDGDVVEDDVDEGLLPRLRVLLLEDVRRDLDEEGVEDAAVPRHGTARRMIDLGFALQGERTLEREMPVDECRDFLFAAFDIESDPSLHRPLDVQTFFLGQMTHGSQIIGHRICSLGAHAWSFTRLSGAQAGETQTRPDEGVNPQVPE